MCSTEDTPNLSPVLGSFPDGGHSPNPGIGRSPTTGPHVIGHHHHHPASSAVIKIKKFNIEGLVNTSNNNHNINNNNQLHYSIQNHCKP
ncbi:hypothetical protein PGT21_021357 [Puccinia graminis f. sp. tritici]|uniref:Uncharacterized protein n=1 Tax=Puccinia graminis f. sp. tritici TaxID=56615 RepID=A0A5B0QN79_PUCGR|nr:hypothetical protein PGT21_021357 [Puccinia graminis f. sp. tritici]